MTRTWQPDEYSEFVSFKGQILLANSNQWYFNKLVKIPCHKTPYRCPHRLNLSSQSSRSCAGPNIKVLKDKDLEFANSIGTFHETAVYKFVACQDRVSRPQAGILILYLIRMAFVRRIRDNQ